MTSKILENVEYFSQRDNKYDPSIACFPTSAAMAMEYYHGDIVLPDDVQLEDYIVKACLDLSQEEKNILVSKNGSWILNHRPFQVIPIMAYVCNKIAPMVTESWSISFEDIVYCIDENRPVVCLGDFSSISYVKGHYNVITGYDKDNQYVWVNDPWGVAYSNYTNKDGCQVYYDWNIFKQNGENSYGLILK